jgi:hypothetical protein
MQIGLPLPYFESEGLENRNCQYHESGTDESDTDGFFVTIVHTATKVQKLSEKRRMKSVKIATARHSSHISSQIYNHSSQTPAEYPRYLELPVNRLTFAIRNINSND